jgi:SAM-dependent methyltransferase
LLEIGCGTGDLLKVLENEGWDVEGLEVSTYAVRLAREQCAGRIAEGTLDDLPDEAGPYDAIVMKHAIEHLPSPATALERCRDHLRPGGRIFLWTPNADSLEASLLGRYWPGWEMPRHLVLLAPKTVRAYAKRLGLEMESLGFETIPNDWVKGMGFLVRELGLRRTARLFSVKNPLIMALMWLPALGAAVLRRGGRLVTVLRREP